MPPALAAATAAAALVALQSDRGPRAWSCGPDQEPPRLVLFEIHTGG